VGLDGDAANTQARRKNLPAILSGEFRLHSSLGQFFQMATVSRNNVERIRTESASDRMSSGVRLTATIVCASPHR
jgi:hypothetical protein